MVFKPNYHTTKTFLKSLSAIEMRKRQIPINKPVYSGLSILEISKLMMYEFWYDSIKPE